MGFLPSGGGGAASLTSLAGHLSAPVSLGINTPTTIMSTASLAVGTWLVTSTACCTSAAVNLFDYKVTLGTATATLEGVLAAGADVTATSLEVAVTLCFIATVTVAGTLTFVGESSGTPQGTATAVTRNYSSANATGWTAVKIA